MKRISTAIACASLLLISACGNGDSDAAAFGPIDAAEGERLVALVAKCPDPKNKFCSCASHQELT